MDRVSNPYVPGAGTPPPALVGRERLLEDVRVLLARVQQKRSERSKFYVGLRGVGKTVLLNRIQYIAREEYGYKTLFLEAPEGKRLAALIIPPLFRMLYELDRYEQVSQQVRKALGAMRSFIGTVKVNAGPIEVGFEPVPGLADSGDMETDFTELMVSIGEAAASRKQSILILIDEIQYLSEEDLRAIIMAAHQIAQRQLPVAFVGAGLPQIVGLSGEAKSYAERLFEFPMLGPLNEQDARKAIIEPALKESVGYEDAAVDEIIRQTKGYPYFLQEWGYESWNAAQLSPIGLEDVNRATPQVLRKLDESFFRVRFDRLTPTEKAYLRAMAELGPEMHRSGDIAGKMGKKVSSVAPIRNSLIRKGMVYSPTHGGTAFTVPLFDEFMMRMVAQRLA